MVERVKASIAEKFSPAIDFRGPYAKVMLAEATRAAIEAMRTPTEAMLDAGQVAITPVEAAASPQAAVLEGLWRFWMTVSWRAMIDAALNPPPP